MYKHTYIDGIDMVKQQKWVETSKIITGKLNKTKRQERAKKNASEANDSNIVLTNARWCFVVARWMLRTWSMCRIYVEAISFVSYTKTLLIYWVFVSIIFLSAELNEPSTNDCYSQTKYSSSLSPDVPMCPAMPLCCVVG